MKSKSHRRSPHGFFFKTLYTTTCIYTKNFVQNGIRATVSISVKVHGPKAWTLAPNQAASHFLSSKENRDFKFFCVLDKSQFLYKLVYWI